MACCGDRRAQLARAARTRTAASARPVRPAQSPMVPTAGATTALAYRGPVPMVLVGPATRAVYRMYAVGDRVDVDSSDAGAFVRSGWFTRL